MTLELTDNIKKQYGIIQSAKSIKDYVKTAFDIFTGTNSELSEVIQFDEFWINQILIHILPGCRFEELISSFGRRDEIKGFVKRYNFKGYVFIREDCLVNVMQVIGHEIGHLMSRRLTDMVNEEAKAYAFKIAWCNIIQNNRIAGLGKEIMKMPIPSYDIEHYSAFKFVTKRIKEGYSPRNLFEDFITGKEQVRGICSIPLIFPNDIFFTLFIFSVSS